MLNFGRVLDAKLAQVGPKLGPEIIKNRSGGLPKSDHIFDWLWGQGFVAIWCQLGSNLAAKTLPKSTQVGFQIDQNLHQDADNFFP